MMMNLRTQKQNHLGGDEEEEEQEEVDGSENGVQSL